MYSLEQACRIQLDVLQTGRAITAPPPDTREHTAQQWEKGAAGIGTGATFREWPALLRMLERKDASFRR
jgi:hypothetical protein